MQPPNRSGGPRSLEIDPRPGDGLTSNCEIQENKHPKNATLQDGKDAFLAWARKNAGSKELMGELPLVGLVRALADKYLCKK